jgi:hypothetical protein
VSVHYFITNYISEKKFSLCRPISNKFSRE